MLTESKPSSITPWKPRPILGPQSTLVLLVQFQDVRFRSSVDEIRSLVDLVDKWFRRSSYGKMYINYTIHEDLLMLPNTMSAYGVPEAGNERGDDPAREEAYVVDVLNTIISQETVDLGEYKHVVLIHAGGDEAETGNPNDLWSRCDCVGPIADENPSREASWVLYDESGKITHAFWGISTFSEDEPWAVFVHEFTHSLGVSDLYVYGSDGYSEGPGVGFWSNMAAGAFLDPPRTLTDGASTFSAGLRQQTSTHLRANSQSTLWTRCRNRRLC
jgi:M6 family metalloprotease-like protein